WPALNANGSPGKKLVILDVRRTRSMMIASCQRTAGAAATPVSVIGVALLPPGIAIGVVAAQLPEAGLVALSELQPVRPFRGLPEIEMRHQQPCRATVIRLQRLALMAQRQHGPALREIGDGDIRRVAIVGMDQRETRGRLDAGSLEKIV